MMNVIKNRHNCTTLAITLAIYVHLLSVAGAQRFRPADNYLIDCGSEKETVVDGDRTFRSDAQSSSFLATSENVRASITNISFNSTYAPLYRTTKIFPETSTYSFFISHPGLHWLRLHFYPLPHPQYNLSASVFSVATDKFVLLHDFSVADGNPVLKEYLFNVTSDRFSLTFIPLKKSCAFINAIELVSAPGELIGDTATDVSTSAQFTGDIAAHALAVDYRLNVGGSEIGPADDTLGRTWIPDGSFLKTAAVAQNVSISGKAVKYPKRSSSLTPLVAPPAVYASAVEMADSKVAEPNFNITWLFKVDPAFSYLIRLHFCDIVSKALNDLYFNVYISQLMGIASLDLSTRTAALATAYYEDFVVNATAVINGTIFVQIGPASVDNDGTPNAILNGVEVMKMSNSANSLDGLFAVDGNRIVYKGNDEYRHKKRIVAAVGLAMAAGAMAVLAVVFVRWQRRPKDWEKRNSFSSWLLPIHVSTSSFMRKGGPSSCRALFGSR